jgi:hypothetical protein
MCSAATRSACPSASVRQASTSRPRNRLDRGGAGTDDADMLLAEVDPPDAVICPAILTSVRNSLAPLSLSA